MNDEELEKKSRPNVNYPLSSNDSVNHKEDGLKFYYNRERRLESAPENVKNMYRNNRAGKGRFSLFGPLVADKPRKILFFVIIFMCVGILALAFFGYFDTTYELDGNRIDISATSFEGMSIVVLRKNARNTNVYTGAVDIFIPIPAQTDEANLPDFFHRIFFSLEAEETYRFAVPFNAPELTMFLENERSTLQIRFRPE
jgi:hypothetical protein